VALKKHLGNTGCRAEVTVDLEWVMKIPEVCCGIVLKKLLYKIVGSVAKLGM
jgi:hypothetical protein